MSANDVTQITELFKNALVYTTILRNVDSLILDKDRSIIMIVLGSSIAALGMYKANNYLAAYLKTPKNNSVFSPGHELAIVGKLALFAGNTITNVLVQLTSSLASTLATAIFTSADSLHWGLSGAVLSIVLLWLLQESMLQSQRT